MPRACPANGGRNALALYSYDNSSFTWAEQDLYGSSRLGMVTPGLTIQSSAPLANANYNSTGDPITNGTEGKRIYELTNHLGNVMVTISDRKTGVDEDSDGVIDYYKAEVLTAQDYYAYGMLMPGRTYSNAGAKYKYGFNGKENDNEVKGDGNQQDYGMRIYDPRLGRFLSVDPIASKYPMLTPYQFASNRPIDGIDLDGFEFMKMFGMQNLLPPLGLSTTYENIHNVAEAQRADPNAGIMKIALKSSWKTASSKIHIGLDVVGLIPAVGEIPDAINGGIYLLESDYSNAAFSFAATIPFAGWAATSGKWAKNALKLSDNAFHSAAGLVFKQGSKEGNRLSHVLSHLVNNTKKANHGVFDATEEGLVSLLDDAYSKIKGTKWNNKLVVGESETVGGITRSLRKEANGVISENFAVDAGKRIGTEGGRKGTGEALNKLQISLEQGTSNVITAFPTK